MKTAAPTVPPFSARRRRGSTPAVPINGLRILNVEDSAEDAELTRGLLAANFPQCEVTLVSNREDYLGALKRSAPALPAFDLILSDFSLPGFDGCEAFELAREWVPNVPFIFYSGTITDELAFQATQLGAADYVNKSSPIRLLTAIERARREQDQAARRRLAEQELQRSEIRCRMLVEQASDALFVHDLSGHILEVNRRAVESLGYTREELLRMVITDLEQELPAGKPKECWESIPPVSPITCYRLQRRKDGSLFPVEVRLSRFDIEGEARFLALVRDITERLADEARLREQNELLNMARDAIVLLSPEHQVLFWNRGAERLFGVPAAKAMGERIVGFIDENVLAHFEAALQTVMTEGEWAGEFRLKRPDEQRVEAEARLSLVRDGDRPRAIIAICSDVTEQRELREKYYRVQRLESVGALAAGIAHDLNNILVPITLAVQLLRNGTHQEQSLRLLQMVESSAARGTGLVQQVLAFANGRGGTVPAVQLKHLLSEMTEIIHATFPKTIHFVCERPASLWPVRGNVGQLHQVLLNLCINARDAMPAGGKLILRAENVNLDDLAAAMIAGARPGAWTMVTVQDTGIGIPPEVRPRIWEAFFTTKKKQGGTGLGLSTVREIVDRHRGFVTLDTRVGEGTTFRVYFPALLQAEDTVAKERATPLRPGTGERILFAEDEGMIRDVTANLLARHNYDVTVAANGAEALEIFTADMSRIRMVICDFEMPKLDGISLARKIRKLNPGVALLMISGSERAAEWIVAAGIDSLNFLPKPFSAHALLERIQQLLAHAAPPPVPAVKIADAALGASPCSSS